VKDRQVRVEPRASELRCAVCHGGLDEAPPCAGCGTVAHAECRADARGCPTLGCAEAPRRIVITAPRPRPRVADVAVVAAIGAALGLVAFALGVVAAMPDAVHTTRWALLTGAAAAFTFMGGWCGAGTAALEQRAAPRAGLRHHWPCAMQLLFVGVQIGLAALLADCFFEPYLAPFIGPIF